MSHNNYTTNFLWLPFKIFLNECDIDAQGCSLWGTAASVSIVVHDLLFEQQYMMLSRCWLSIFRVKISVSIKRYFPRKAIKLFVKPSFNNTCQDICTDIPKVSNSNFEHLCIIWNLRIVHHITEQRMQLILSQFRILIGHIWAIDERESGNTLGSVACGR